MKILAVVLTIVVILLAVGQIPQSASRPSTPAQISQAGTGGGLVYVNPPNVTSQRVNTQFNVTVQVSGMDYFTGWDISVETSSSDINPIKVSIAGNLFLWNYSQSENQLANCVNGSGLSCSLPPNGLDGPGVARSAADLIGQPTVQIQPPIDGTLFVITYNVTSNPGYSRIHIASNTFVNNTIHGSGVVPSTPQDGVYGTPGSPDFTLSLSSTSINIAQGTSASISVSLHSLLKFNGTIALSTTGKINGTYDQPYLNLTSITGTNSTRLTIAGPYALSPTLYLVTIVADYSTTIRHKATLQVSLQPSVSFLMGFDHAQIPIHGGLSSNVTIMLTSQFNFAGAIHLSVNLGKTNVTYILGSSDLLLAPNGANSTFITITPPSSASKVIYYVFVTGSHRFPTFWQNVTEPIKIVPPPPSLAITTDPIQLSIQAGQGANATVTVLSVDYFYGYAYVSAVMQGGKASFDHYSYFFPLPDPTHPLYIPSTNFTLMLKIGPRTIPGNYVILLTAYSITNGNQTATSTQASILLTIINPNLFHTSSAPITVLGLAPSMYYAFLGVVVVPFALLAGLAVRKWRDDKDETYLRE